MQLTSIGDLARSLNQNLRSTAIKREIQTLTSELSSGQTSNPLQRLSGDYSQIASIDRSLALFGAYRSSTSEAGVLADAMQSGVENIRSRVNGLSASLVSVGSFDQEVNRNQLSTQAADDLQFLVSTLNGAAAGKSLFAGTATDTAPLESDQTLLSTLRSVVSGQTTPDDIMTAATNWFDDPAGFAAVIYRGSASDLRPMRLSSSQSVTLSLRADDPVFRETLKNTALAALATDPALGLSDVAQSQLLQKTGTGLLNTRDQLVELQADVGYAQSLIETTAARNAASRSSLEFARNELLGVDEYEVATRLERVQFQLESLYAASVRTSRLSLVNFLR